MQVYTFNQVMFQLSSPIIRAVLVVAVGTDVLVAVGTDVLVIVGTDVLVASTEDIVVV